MRRTFLIGGLGLVLAALVPSGLSTTGSVQALDCPAAGLATACSGVGLVVGTACTNPYPPVGTIGSVTIDIEGSAPVDCPDI